MNVPFHSRDPFAGDHDELLHLVHEVGLGERFILGDRVAALERELKQLLGAVDAVACASGMGALRLSLRALGVDRGHEVVVPAFGGLSAASTVIDLGAAPVFVDVDDRTMALDPGRVDEAVTSATRAMVVAHPVSTMADLPALRSVADRHSLALVEEANVALGASHEFAPASRWCDTAVLSVSATDPLGSCGEGGIVVTGSPEIGDRCRMLRNHGQDGVHRFLHHVVGSNNRMDELVAGFLLHRLQRLTERLGRCAAIAAHYTDRLAPLADRGVRVPQSGFDSRVPAAYVILTGERDELADELACQGIGTRVLEPWPLSAQPALAAHLHDGHRHPNAEAVRRKHLALPLYADLTDAHVEVVTDSVVAFFSRWPRESAR